MKTNEPDELNLGGGWGAGRYPLAGDWGARGSGHKSLRYDPGGGWLFPKSSILWGHPHRVKPKKP
eukprot:4589723-Pyramimonas_sp.AAC.1